MARSGFSRLTARTRSAYKLDGLRARGNARSVCLIGPPWSVMPARRPRRLRACSASKVLLHFFKSRGRGAVRQRKFGFQTKLPGRKRPSSGVFSDLRSEARHTPRRPLSLPCGRGVGDPSPQAPPRQAGLGCFLLFHNLKFYSIFFKKSRGRGAEPPTRSAERGTLSPVKRIFRVNCREAARGGFLQVKKPPCINKIRNRFLGRQPAWAGMFFLTAAAERAILIRVRNHILFLRCCFYNKKR